MGQSKTRPSVWIKKNIHIKGQRPYKYCNNNTISFILLKVRLPLNKILNIVEKKKIIRLCCIIIQLVNLSYDIISRLPKLETPAKYLLIAWEETKYDMFEGHQRVNNKSVRWTNHLNNMIQHIEYTKCAHHQLY